MKKYSVDRSGYIKSLSYHKVINIVIIFQAIIGLISSFGPFGKIGKIVGIALCGSACFVAMVATLVEIYYSYKN